MATEETKCSDNFYLPIGPQGPRGEQGLTGAQGPGGAVTQGPAGPAGGNKIDINFQIGSTPYMEATVGGEWERLAHFIFPGTSEFTPSSWRVAVGYYLTRGSNDIKLQLGYLQNDGTKVIVASIDEVVSPSTQGFVYKIFNASSFNGLPSAASNFFVEGKVTKVGKEFRTRYFATELR